MPRLRQNYAPPSPVWVPAGVATVATIFNLTTLTGLTTRMDPGIDLPKNLFNPRIYPFGVVLGTGPTLLAAGVRVQLLQDVVPSGERTSPINDN